MHTQQTAIFFIKTINTHSHTHHTRTHRLPTIPLYKPTPSLQTYLYFPESSSSPTHHRPAMVDNQIVCAMCGDVGFPEKLFRCNKCHNRFQHSYCSNYYSESSEPIEVCDWCKSEQRNVGGKAGGSSSRKASAGNDASRSEYAPGERIKQQHDGAEGSERGKSGGGSGGAPSPRTSTRRYKLLKDVMC